jgi:cell division protein ZapA|nr:cell division protein ZapA [Priestia megaterium]
MIGIRIFRGTEDFLVSRQDKTRATVDIFGQQYSIVGSESTSHIRLVASIVDEKMREISTKNPSLDINKLAVLTAVNAVHEYIKLKEDYERLEQKLYGKEE